ncbi:hypothetical protein [Persicirhabdus sediminis]|uniref:Uncharacterized protein n=1 Tax=Persicirhabdus sediminis TaxID=454144 RepID=A0A8J7MCZ5_9BACT|nr:hypothetical protein [Persicirhabdus sediminis]MBK1791087.1 hypothetical protein [Persicirhabdus sediminis]
MSISEDKKETFNDQMNDWVSRQGLWFQLRHSGGHSFIGKMIRLCIRVTLVIIVLSMAGLYFLKKRVASPKLASEIAENISTSLGAELENMSGYRHHANQASFSQLVMLGGDSSFFDKAEVEGMRFNMSMFDGIFGAWDGGGISIGRLALDIKAGAENDELAQQAYDSLFTSSPNYRFNRLDVEEVELKWGYSEKNRGAITGSAMRGRRDDGRWILNFKGGTFSQNWIHSFDIVEMQVVCSDEGVEITEAVLTSEDGGTFRYQLELGAGGQPSLAGKIELKSFPLNSLLPDRFHSWVSGSVSGTGKVTGSTNGAEGVVIAMDVELSGADSIVVRSKLPVIRALDTIDLYNSYGRIDFKQGRFKMTTRRGLVEIHDLDMKAGNLLSVKGDIMVVRTGEGIQEFEATMASKADEKLQQLGKTDDNYSLRDAVGDAQLIDKESVELESQAKEKGVVAKINVMQPELAEAHYSGMLDITLQGDAFDKSNLLKKEYPPNADTGRIHIEVPLFGKLGELTVSQAEMFYMKGRNRRALDE